MNKQKISLFGVWISGVILIVVFKLPARITVICLSVWSILCGLPILHYGGQRLLKALTKAGKGYLSLLLPQTEKSEFTLGPTGLEYALLRQLNCRITEKLRFFYPKATWQWEGYSDDFLTHGGSTRIQTCNTDEYSMAEIILKKDGDLIIRMLRLEELSFVSSQKSVSGDKNTSPIPEEVRTIDVKSWFSILGQNAINEIISELHTQGFRSLSILETGQIQVLMNGEPSVFPEELESFPPKEQWDELSSILTKEGLSVAQNKDSLQLAWEE